MSEVITAISTVGFPIVACCFMGWYVTKLTDVISDLKVAITELTTLMQTKEDDE